MLPINHTHAGTKVKAVLPEDGPVDAEVVAIPLVESFKNNSCTGLIHLETLHSYCKTTSTCKKQEQHGCFLEYHWTFALVRLFRGFGNLNLRI